MPVSVQLLMFVTKNGMFMFLHWIKPPPFCIHIEHNIKKSQKVTSFLFLRNDYESKKFTSEKEGMIK